MEDADKIWAVIISAITGTGVYLSAVADFLIAGPILGVVAGFTLSYVVQTKTQKRAWKREFLLKNIDQIYGPLYNDSLALERQYISMVNDHRYFQFQSQNWDRIRNSYTYHMIEEEEFRNELSKFYLSIETHNENVRESRELIDEIVNRIGRKYYDVDVEGITFFQKDHNRLASAGIKDCLLFNIHPKEILGNEDMSIQIMHKLNNASHGIEFTKKEELEEFEKVWTEMIRETTKHAKIESVRKNAFEINLTNQRIRDKLVKRISERQKL